MRIAIEIFELTISRHSVEKLGQPSTNISTIDMSDTIPPTWSDRDRDQFWPRKIGNHFGEVTGAMHANSISRSLYIVTGSVQCR